jgi:hypothetical protein
MVVLLHRRRARTPCSSWGSCGWRSSSVWAAANQRRFPFTDDWNLVPFVIDRPVTFSWFWRSTEIIDPARKGALP